MIEAIYVVVIAVMMIFFLINVGFLYYNRMVVTAVADEAAASIANQYGHTGREPFFAYVESGAFRGMDPYRHLWRDKLETSVVSKGKWYASYLLSELEWTKEERADFDDVTVVFGKNDMGMDTVSVTIDTSYPVLSFEPMSFFGLETEYQVKATGVAVCYDPIYQMNATAFVSEFEKNAMGTIPVVKDINGFIEVIYKFIDKNREKSR